jgi:hypothetical protein
MFTEQAAVKLKDILETFLSQAPKGTDDASPEKVTLTVSTVTPAQGPQAGGTVVNIQGKKFAQGATVTFGGQSATGISVTADGTSITATTPAAAKAGPVTVEVTNPDSTMGSKASGFNYE